MKIKKKIVSCHTADSKTVKKEVNGTVILPPLVFPAMYVKKREGDGLGTCFAPIRLFYI